MENMFKRLPLIVLSTVVMVSTAGATDNAHFYKAPHLYKSDMVSSFHRGKKAVTTDWMTNIDVNVAYGDSKTAWGKDGNTCPLLNTTGDYNMLLLAQNVPALPDIFDQATFIAKQLPQFVGLNDTFGKLRFSGKFSDTEVNINLQQNLLWGFFLQAHLPVRDVKIDQITYADLSLANGLPNNAMAIWRQFINNFDHLLANYGLAPAKTAYSQSGIGDLSLLLGWRWAEKHDQKAFLTHHVLMLKGGFLLSTGEEDDVNRVFSLPIGYNDHTALLGNAQLDLEFCKYFTLSGNGGVTYFFDNDTKQRRMQTFAGQNGWIKLMKGEAKEEKGFIWHAGGDLTFDFGAFGHSLRGLTILGGYSFTHQDADKLTPKDTVQFPTAVVNADSRLHAWNMHTVHFMLAYDFSNLLKKTTHFAPRLNLFYNLPVDGKNAFKTEMFGGGVGLDLRWKI